MPKEVFYGRGCAGSSFEVRWGRRGHVYLDWVCLHQEDLERLRRVLSKAEDQAYGVEVHLPEYGWFYPSKSDMVRARETYGLDFRVGSVSQWKKFFDENPHIENDLDREPPRNDRNGYPEATKWPEPSVGWQVVYWVVDQESKEMLFGPTFDRKAAWEFADAQPGIPLKVRKSYLKPEGDTHWRK